MLESQLVERKSLLNDVKAKVQETNMQFSHLFSEFSMIKVPYQFDQLQNQPVWFPIDIMEGVDLSNNRKTIKNNSPDWLNLPFGTLEPIYFGKWKWTYVIDFAKPGNSVAIGVFPASKWSSTVGKDLCTIKNNGYLFSWNGGKGEKFGKGSWDVKSGYKPGEKINMVLDADSGVLTFTRDNELLATCTGIPKLVIPIASLYKQVVVTLISVSK